MRKPTDIIIDIAAQAYSSALRLLATHHTTSDLLDFIKDVGGEIEIFLKQSIYHNERNRDTFDTLINDLIEIGVSQVSVDALHEIRRKYNKAKHETDNSFNSIDLVNVLKGAKESLVELKSITKLEEAIYIELIYKFAASRHSPYIKEFVPHMAELLSVLKEGHRKGLEGPFFLSKKSMRQYYLIHT